MAGSVAEFQQGTLENMLFQFIILFHKIKIELQIIICIHIKTEKCTKISKKS